MLAAQFISRPRHLMQCAINGILNASDYVGEEPL